jgi:hypothetical protein
LINMSYGGKRAGAGRKPVTKKAGELAESTLHLWKHERLEFLQSLKAKMTMRTLWWPKSGTSARRQFRRWPVLAPELAPQ